MAEQVKPSRQGKLQRQGKITVKVEIPVLALRNTFEWGTAGIQQGLFNLPDYMRESVPCAQGVRLSREAINNVLTKHDINGYPRKHKSWKFFRAKEPGELWQTDLKGPFTVHGQKYWSLVAIDDFSRFFVLAGQLGHEPAAREITTLPGNLGRSLAIQNLNREGD